MWVNAGSWSVECASRRRVAAVASTCQDARCSFQPSHMQPTTACEKVPCQACSMAEALLSSHTPTHHIMPYWCILPKDDRNLRSVSIHLSAIGGSQCSSFRP